MISRQLESWLHANAKRSQVIHVMGLRQTGKTTLMDLVRRNFKDSLHYPLHDLVTLRRYESQPETWVLELEGELEARRGTGKLPLHVFVDEVQKIPSFFQAIQGLYDKHKGVLKFWIWGSSAVPQKKRRAETLAGRVLIKTLWPLSQAELLGRESVVPLLTDPRQLRKAVTTREPRGYRAVLGKWLTHSLLPEPNQILSLSQAQDLLLSFQATYLENEIRRENLVKDIGIFEQIVSLAAGESGSIANFLKLGRTVGTSSHTVKSFFEILKDTFVCRILPAYSRSLRVQISKSPKHYFTDIGLARFVAGERSMLEKASVNFGRHLEGFVINELFKQVEYGSLPWKLNYLRTKTGVEANLIISSEDVKFAVEIKAASRIDGSDLRGMRKIMELDPSVAFGILVSMQPAPFDLGDKLYNVPIWCL
jgi:predicted AAA+ superfamily ATPase